MWSTACPFKWWRNVEPGNLCPNVFQGDNSQEHRETCYESGENKEITEPWF